MNTTTAPAGDAAIRDDTDRLKIARRLAVYECMEIEDLFNQLAHGSPERALPMGMSPTEAFHRTLCHTMGEMLFATARHERLRLAVNDIFRLLDSVALPAKSRPSPGDDYCESAHLAAVATRHRVLDILVRAKAFIRNRVVHYKSVGNMIRERRKTPSDEPLHAADFYHVPERNREVIDCDWLLTRDWLNIDIATSALHEAAKSFPNGDGTFYRDLRTRVLTESKQAISFAQQLRYGTVPIILPPTEIERVDAVLGPNLSSSRNRPCPPAAATPEQAPADDAPEDGPVSGGFRWKGKVFREYSIGKSRRNNLPTRAFLLLEQLWKRRGNLGTDCGVSLDDYRIEVKRDEAAYAEWKHFKDACGEIRGLFKCNSLPFNVTASRKSSLAFLEELSERIPEATPE